jgi:hypothetical protein
MSWYKTGSIVVNNGSNVVDGVGTDFIGGKVVAGFGLLGPDYSVYEVESIVSATRLTLTSIYRGPNATSGSYAIWQTQGIIADLASVTTELLNTFGAFRQAYLDGELVGKGLVPKGVLTDVSQLPSEPEVGDTYFIGPVVYAYSGTVHGWISQNIAGVSPRGAWSAVSAYNLNDLVQYGGSQYCRRVAGTSAGTPDSDVTNWNLFVVRGAIGPAGVTPRGAWSAENAYVVNDLATYGGAQYRRKVAGTTATTPALDATNWELFLDKGKDGLGQVMTVSSIAPDASGNVALVKANVGLGNVDNTSDTAKPVSTLQAAAIAAKASTAGATFTGAVVMPSGSVAAAALQVGGAGTGLYSPAANTLALAANGIQGLSVDSVGRLMTPNQPIASVNSAPSVSAGSGAYTVRVYANALVNRGSWYSTSTGRFTAQAAGVVTVSGGESSAGGIPALRVRKNGAWVGGSSLCATTNSSMAITISVAVAVGDYLDVCLYGDGGTTGIGNGGVNSWAVFEFKG